MPAVPLSSPLPSSCRAACSSSSRAAAALNGTTPRWARCAAACRIQHTPQNLQAPPSCTVCMHCALACQSCAASHRRMSAAPPQAAWISAIVGAVCAVVAVTVQWFVIRKRVERDLKLEIEQVGALPGAGWLCLLGLCAWCLCAHLHLCCAALCGDLQGMSLPVALARCTFCGSSSGGSRFSVMLTCWAALLHSHTHPCSVPMQEAARAAAAAALQVPDVEQPGSDPGMQLEGAPLPSSPARGFPGLSQGSTRAVHCACLPACLLIVPTCVVQRLLSSSLQAFRCRPDHLIHSSPCTQACTMS